MSRRRIGLALAALAAALTLSGATSATVATAITPSGAGTVSVLTFNMCGEHCNADSTAGDITQLMATIDAHQPNVVFLQEVCRAQYTALKNLSSQSGNWQLYGYTDVTEPHGCANGSDSFGDAILTHSPFAASSVDVLTLPYPHGHGVNHQVRKEICLRSVGFPRPTEVCTTHIGLDFEIGVPHVATQIHDAYKRARKDGYHVPLVLGGDFNVVPTANALDAVYATGGGGAHGAMKEADACSAKSGGRKHHSATCNAYTHGNVVGSKLIAKNDYVFVSQKSFTKLSATTLTTTYSDHVPVLASGYECSSGNC